MDVWHDSWVPWIQGFIPTPKHEAASQSTLKVSQLIDPTLHCWNTSLIHDLFVPSSAQAILSIPIHSRPYQDKLMWILDYKGCFSVKSAYQELNPHLHPPNPSYVEWRKLWKLKGPKRIKMFLWRVTVNALPTKENLMCCMDIEDTCCVLCDQECETSSHLFVKCLAAKALWFSVYWGLRSNELHLSTSADIIKLILKPPLALCQAQDQWLVSLNMAFTLEEIWHTCNVVLHHKGEVDL